MLVSMHWYLLTLAIAYLDELTARAAIHIAEYVKKIGAQAVLTKSPAENQRVNTKNQNNSNSTQPTVLRYYFLNLNNGPRAQCNGRKAQFGKPGLDRPCYRTLLPGEHT